MCSLGSRYTKNAFYVEVQELTGLLRSSSWRGRGSFTAKRKGVEKRRTKERGRDRKGK